MAKRKTYNRRADIPAELLAAFNDGAVETLTLAESLAVDMRRLMNCVDPSIPAARLAELSPEVGVTARMRNAGALLLEFGGAASYKQYAAHPSDTVRGWAAHQLGLSDCSLAETFDRLRPLADDPNSGVREWAWMGVRPKIAAELEQAIRWLTRWTGEPSANLRRFAVESTRPRGVWCAHIDALRKRPQLGLPLLEPLRADPTKYVQDSVSNWLNDASKTQPDWVRNLVKRWVRESPGPHTARIGKRALRSLELT